ncbi:MAG: LysM peptidoglycan-binding domain-containing protein [Gemmobacter sp.]
MADAKPFGGATGAVILGAGAVAVAGLVWYVQQAPAPVEPAAESQAADTSPAVQPTAPVAAEAPSAQPPAAADTAAPKFDTVRVSPDGDAVVAGRADPGAEVSLRVDGKEIARATADAAGNFVSMFDLPTSDAARALDLVTLGPEAVASTDTVVLSPTAAPAPTTLEAGETATASLADAPAPTPPTAILLSDQGATVLQGAAQAAPGAVTIAAIAYTPDGAVQLSGVGTPTATVRLYLNNTGVADALVAGNGTWVSVLRNVAPGVYQLRADQIDTEGKVTSRFETPFQRETPEALAAAMKPAAAAGVPVPRSPTEAAPAPTPSATAVAPVSITVQPGFTLWQIAREKLGDGVMYVQVFEANKEQIRDPDLIYPGQVFTIPDQ